MKRKIYHWIFGLCMLAGFYVILCTAGASDLNQINMSEIIVRGCIGVVLLLVSYIGLKLSGWEYIA